MATPDLTTYHVIHRALRDAAHRLDAAVRSLEAGDRRRAKALARYWDGYAGEIRSHHEVEDVLFFPALAERVPGTTQHVARTDADHQHLDELLAAGTAAMTRLVRDGDATDVAVVVAEVADHLDEHLGFEDAEVLPLFAANFTAEEYDAIDAKAVKLVGVGKQAAFTVPFIVSYMSDEERERALSTAPAALRILWRLTRRGHARLAERAFGAAAAPATVG